MDRRTISLHVGARWSFALFACTLVAFVVESELTQYLQTNLGYRQPFFIFYLVHSTFAIIFPLHLLYLSLTTKHSAAEYINGLSVAITNHLRPSRVSTTDRFPTATFLRLIFGLTVGITMPGLLWFQAISLASVSDVTAIWNANAFFAYLMTFNLKWEPRRLLAVILATLGVLVVVYGGSRASNADSISRSSFKPSAPLVGDLLTLIASIGYALYQVLYKRYAALPTDPELLAESAYEHLPSEDPIGDNPHPQILMLFPHLSGCIRICSLPQSGCAPSCYWQVAFPFCTILRLNALFFLRTLR
ncbi:unnamed protein product [Mycena citricolor]|uniref:EamA domain-containing protein n=1 Tax=Mycena citricolor TaxID=2018698 RepID=A0AAD2HPR8_9AGAR|nr:unnamed protein product [Mycena citricolor]